MVFQRPVLLPWRTVLENVLFPLEMLGWPTDPRRDEAKRLIDLVGLAGFENALPGELSGGMQQRVSICRALVHQPKLLLLDEPFAALDAFTREELWCILRDLWTHHRFTVVLVTHDLREAAFLADTVYVMSKRPGRILARRTIDLPRPRELEITYNDHFAEIVRELREHIGRIRAS
jgi:NitT/TauT family transport system ATP-binding protein